MKPSCRLCWNVPLHKQFGSMCGSDGLETNHFFAEMFAVVWLHDRRFCCHPTYKGRCTRTMGNGIRVHIQALNEIWWTFSTIIPCFLWLLRSDCVFRNRQSSTPDSMKYIWKGIVRQCNAVALARRRKRATRLLVIWMHYVLTTLQVRLCHNHPHTKTNYVQCSSPL